MQLQATPKYSPAKSYLIKKLKFIIENADRELLELQKRCKQSLKESGAEKPVGGNHDADIAAPVMTNPYAVLTEALSKKIVACRNAIERIKHNPNPWECEECGAYLKVKDLIGRSWASRHKECQAEFEENEEKLQKLLRRESTHRRKTNHRRN